MARSLFSSIDRRPVVISSHPRSGTHATIDLFRRQFQECRSWKKRGERLIRLYLPLESLYPPGVMTSPRKAVEILQRVQRPLVKTHLDLNDLIEGRITALEEAAPGLSAWLKERADFYYLYRDGRDVMLSLQLMRQRHDRSTICPFSEFIRQEHGQGMSRVEYWARSVDQALKAKFIHPIRFEDLIVKTREVIDRVAEQSNLTPIHQEPLMPKPLRSYWMGRWHRLVFKRPESTSVIGRWHTKQLPKRAELFSASDLDYFQREAGDLLTRLGYET